MPLQQIAGPALEPLSLDETKAHLRVDGSDEDAIIQSLILTSRLHIEAALGLGLITQSWRLILDAWPSGGEIKIPMRPLQSVSEVRVLSSNGAAEAIAESHYIVDATSLPGRLVFAGAMPRPGRKANGIEIDFMAGYGAAPEDVPQPIRQALLMLVAHWYEHRDPVEIGTAGVAIPASVSRLLKPFRLVRL